MGNMEGQKYVNELRRIIKRRKGGSRKVGGCETGQGNYDESVKEFEDLVSDLQFENISLKFSV